MIIKVMNKNRPALKSMGIMFCLEMYPCKLLKKEDATWEESSSEPDWLMS